MVNMTLYNSLFTSIKKPFQYKLTTIRRLSYVSNEIRCYNTQKKSLYYNFLYSKFNSYQNLFNKQNKILLMNFHSHLKLNYEMSTLEPQQYYQLSEEALMSLVDQFEEIVQEYGDDSYDVEYASGVLNLKLGDHGTYVINKQPPNAQIWLSSPLSGPKRYDYDNKYKVWFYQRDQQRLDELLSEEFSKLFNLEIKIQL